MCPARVPAPPRAPCSRSRCSADGERNSRRRPANVVCCSSPVPGAPELWKAVPVQEHNSVPAAGDFGARLRTAAVERKAPPLRRRLQELPCRARGRIPVMRHEDTLNACPVCLATL
ncbi:unnamed protein product [Coccothraustes coccothraustes]